MVHRGGWPSFAEYHRTAEMPDLTQIAKAIDFVEGNLCEPITVADMAAGRSLFALLFLPDL